MERFVETGRSQSPPDSEVVKDIFADACELSGIERERLLNERCGKTGLVRTEVENLLRAHEQAGRFMADPPAAVSKASPTVLPEPEELPLNVGRFKLVRLLGQGGFGAVYEAEQEYPVRRTVALKIIKLGMDTKQVIARFEAERQALAMMEHPGIARVFDAGATETGRPYFVMELVRGVPVTQYCDTKRLTIRQRLELFIAVCLAVGHAHQKGVIHRDIKPSNVLVSDQDGSAVPKVIDFGVAKAAKTGLADGTAFTEIRQLVGTLEYMSPEQADFDASGIDTRSDIYSLGALLYELLTGTPPFESKSLRGKGYSDVQRMIRDVDPAPPSSRVAARGESATVSAAERGIEPWRLAALLRGDLDRVVAKCLEKDRERRYASATALADDIKRYLAGEPVSAVPATAAYRMRKFVTRHKATVSAVAIVAVALVLGFGVSTGLFFRTRAAKLRAETAEKTAQRQRELAQAAQQRAEQNAIAATREAQRAATVSTFLANVFSLAEPESGSGGQEANVNDVLRRAAAEVDRLADRPQEQLMARRMLAEACGRIFLHDLTVQQLRLAHDLSVTLPGGAKSAQSLDIATELAMAMYVARHGEEAAPMARATLADCRRELGMRHPVTWEALQAAALCESEEGRADDTYALLKELVETVRQIPEARRSDGLGRYLCNWSICLRDRGEFDAASSALREAAAIFRAELSKPPAPPVATTAPAVDFSNLRLRLLQDRSPYMLNASGWIVRLMVESGLPEVLPLLENNITDGLASFPQGTPTIAYRLEDLANLRLRQRDFPGAAAAAARSVVMSYALRGFAGEPEVARWRMWIMRCNPVLMTGWRSTALRDQVYCALDDMLRDHPTARLAPEEMMVDRLKFKLVHWLGEGEGKPLAEGNLEQLKSLPDPPAGLYLLGLEVPRLGEEPLRKANWLLLSPWDIRMRPIVRYDALRTDNSPNDRDWTAVLANRTYEQRQTLGLGLSDGIDLATANPRRLQWFTAIATSTVNLPPGRYRISASSDDGTRVFVDGQRVLNDWSPRPSGTSDCEIDLSAGPHELRVDLFQETGWYSLFVQVMPMTPAAKTASAALGGGVPGAEWHAGWWGFVERQYPLDPQYMDKRAPVLAAAGRFRDAEAEYLKIINRGPAPPRIWYARAALLGYLGDVEQYRQACRALIERFGFHDDPGVVAQTLLSCSMRSPLPVDAELFRQVLDRASVMQPPPADAPLFALACGLAQYRAGRLNDAVGSLRTALTGLPSDSPSTVAAAWLGLALVEHQFGHSTEAADAFTHAARLMETDVRRAGVDDLLPGGFENWLVCQTLWAQAEPVLKQ